MVRRLEMFGMLFLALAACGNGKDQESESRDQSWHLGELEKKTVGAEPGQQFPSMETKESDMTQCDLALRMIEARDFRQWHGLPKDCDWTQLTGEPWRQMQQYSTRPLVSERENTFTLPCKLSGYNGSSLSFENDQPFLFDARKPELTCSVPELLQALGKAAAKLDYYEGMVNMSAMEWVYPDRGITLYMVDEGNAVGMVALYASTTLDAYMDQTLRLNEHEVPRPYRTGK